MLSTIRRRLILLVPLVAVPLVAATSLVVHQLAWTQQQAQRSALFSSTRTLAAAIDGEIEKHLAIAKVLATAQSLENGDFAEFYRRASIAVSVVPGAWLLLVDPDGQQLLNTSRPYGEPLPKLANSNPHRQAMATGAPQISDVFTGTVSRRPLTSVHVPVMRGGKPIYNLIVTMDPERFRKILQAQQVPERWISGIIDRKGDFVARSRNHDRLVGMPASIGWRTAAAQMTQGEIENLSIEGEPLFSAFVNSPLSGWSISIAASQQAVMAPFQRSLWLIALSAAGLIAISLGLAWWAARRISEPIRSLQSAAAALLRNEPVTARRTGLREIDQALAAFEASTAALIERDERYRSLFENAADAIFMADHAGQFIDVNPAAGRLLGLAPQELTGRTFFDFVPEAEHPRLIAARDDVRRGHIVVDEWQLRHASGALVFAEASSRLLPDGRWYAFVRDVTQRKLAEAAREETEHQFQTLADSIPQLAWMVGADGAIFWYNQRWFDYTGATFAEMQGRGWRAVHHPDHVDGVAERFRRAIESGEPWEDTFPLRGKDGRYRWFLSRALPIRDAEGKIVRWFGTNTDISEQKETEERQRLLVNELNHRVKNTLAVIQSIAAVTARSAGSVAEFSRNFIARLIGIARTHDLLTASHWEGASLRDILVNELRPYDAGAPSRVSLHGPPVRLPPAGAVTLGMVLHEMATNAAKHGALSVSDGRVSVNWTEHETAQGPRLRIEWIESGGPPVTAPSRQGFGSRLIRDSLANALSGSVVLDYRPDGLRCVLELPLTRAEPAPAAAA